MKLEQHLQAMIVSPLGRGLDAQKEVAVQQKLVTGPELRTIYDGNVEGESPMSQLFIRHENFLPLYTCTAYKENKTIYQSHFFTPVGSHRYLKLEY